MPEKTRFVEKIKAQLDAWDEDLELMKDTASQSSAEIKAYYVDRFEKLKKKRDTLAHRLSQLTDATDDAWEDFKKGVENAWDELKHAFDEDKKKEDKS